MSHVTDTLSGPFVCLLFGQPAQDAAFGDEQARRQETDERDKNEKREAPRKSPEREKSAKPLKFTFAEQKEYAEIDAVIAGVEAELRSVGKAINTAGSDYSRLQELTTAQTELEAKLEHLMDRWTYLNELAEKIEQN